MSARSTGAHRWLPVLVVVALGCPGAPTGSDRGQADAGVDAGPVAELDAGPRILPLTLVAVVDGGEVAVALDPLAEVEVDPAERLVVSTPVVLSGPRIQLLDWQDRIVESDDRLLIADGGTSVTIGLLTPLETGRTYVLSIEPDMETLLTDVHGQAWEEVRQAIRVRGEVAPPPPPKKQRTRRR